MFRWSLLGAAAGSGLALLVSITMKTDPRPLAELFTRVEAAAATLTGRGVAHEPPRPVETRPPTAASPQLESQPIDVPPAPTPPIHPPPPAETSLSPEPSGFAPYTVRPELRDRAQAARLVEQYYPTLLKEMGVEGSVLVALLVDTVGHVSDARVLESSGQRAFDEAALAAAGRLRFTPAVDRERRVAVWVSVPIVFTLK